MVSLGNISVGVSLDGVERAIKQSEELKESLSTIEEPAERSTESMEQMSDKMEQVEQSTGDTVPTLQRTSSWMDITRNSAGRLGGALNSITATLGGIGLISGLKTIIGYLGLSGGLAGVTKVVTGALGTLAGAVSGTAIAIGALLGLTAIVIADLLGWHDATDDLIYAADDLLEEWTGIEDPIYRSIKAITHAVWDFIDVVDKSIDKIVTLYNKAQNMKNTAVDSFLSIPSDAVDITQGALDKLNPIPKQTKGSKPTSNTTQQNIETQIELSTDGKSYSDMSKREQDDLVSKISEKISDDVNTTIR